MKEKKPITNKQKTSLNFQVSRIRKISYKFLGTEGKRAPNSKIIQKLEVK